MFEVEMIPCKHNQIGMPLGGATGGKEESTI